MLKKLFAGLTVFTIAAIVGVGLSRAADGEVLSYAKISDAAGDFTATFADFDQMGGAVASIDDLNSDGVNELVVGIAGNNDGGEDTGAVYIVFLEADGSVHPTAGVSGQGWTKISESALDFTATLNDGDGFGSSVASIGDLNGDGVPDIAVGAENDDDGGGAGNQGAVYIIYLESNGSVHPTAGVSTDGWTKISAASLDFTATLDDGDNFGSAVAGVGDLNGDGMPDIAVGAENDDDGGDGRGAVYIIFLETADGSVHPTAGVSTDGWTKISDDAPSFNATLSDGDNFGSSLAELDDLNSDGISELVVGTFGSDDGGSGRGAVYIVFLDNDGSLDDASGDSGAGWSIISDSADNFGSVLSDNDQFGYSVANLGDLNGDDIPDIAVGANRSNGGGSLRGTLYIIFLNEDGILDGVSGASGVGYTTISDAVGGFGATIEDADFIGASITNMGDIDGDRIQDIVIGAVGDDDEGSSRGALYVLFLDGVPEPLPSTPSSPNPPSAFTFGIADTGTCTWDPNVYLSVRGSNLQQVIISDNLRFVGAQVLPYTPNNGSTVLPDHLTPVDNTMYIAFKLPSYATTVDPATGARLEVPLYGPYSVYAVGRSGSGNITSIQTDSITFSSSEDCTYPYEVILEEDTGNGSEEGNEGEGEEEPVDPLIPVERHQIISLSANMNDLTNEFYLVDTAADGSLVKRPDPRVTNYDISFSWLNKGYSFLSVNQRTLDSLPTAHAMLPEGPAILKFTEGSQNYFYIPSDNSAPREITTPNLANELFLGTPWQSSVWILGPEVPSSSVPHGRTIPRYDVAIVRDWRNNR